MSLDQSHVDLSFKVTHNLALDIFELRPVWFRLQCTDQLTDVTRVFDGSVI